MIPSSRPPAGVTSSILPATNGPLSLILTLIDLPLHYACTTVPNDRVLWAAVMAFGSKGSPLAVMAPAGEDGICSWYDSPPGALTADGENYSQTNLTAAHKTLPMGTCVEVSCNGKSVVVRINDRGPFVAGRVLDMSRAAAEVLGIIDSGLCQCNLAVIPFCV
ncbi:unnamed protein product [Oppiella nova]|uniref:RlpA-like protein double-psi beta-barrel domain-containing protein n=1 Tax=Oppiella nova TaxID=334625 RepID=A0A7R9QTP4_9ACAR|nr:unnamed protein product [Oppiella nova]CAG2174534.1 unnamed protein product [Oppiella nova]